jgi:hypothetical protein
MKISKLNATGEGETSKEQVKSLLIIFFDIHGIVYKEFALASKAVSSVWLLREDVLRLLLKFGAQRTRHYVLPGNVFSQTA